MIGKDPTKRFSDRVENYLSNYPNFQSIEGTAESTNLPNKSIDVITAAQAFHWFKIAETQNEFSRILKSKGNIVLIWNVRDLDDAFQKDYDQLILANCPEYQFVYHRDISHHDLVNFFGTNQITKFVCEYHQPFDFESLRGRLESSSYAPTKDEKIYQPMMKTLRELFANHQIDGKVKFAYKTEMSCGIPKFTQVQRLLSFISLDNS